MYHKYKNGKHDIQLHKQVKRNNYKTCEWCYKINVNQCYNDKCDKCQSSTNRKDQCCKINWEN